MGGKIEEGLGDSLREPRRWLRRRDCRFSLSGGAWGGGIPKRNRKNTVPSEREWLGIKKGFLQTYAISRVQREVRASLRGRFKKNFQTLQHTRRQNKPDAGPTPFGWLEISDSSTVPGRVFAEVSRIRQEARGSGLQESDGNEVPGWNAASRRGGGKKIFPIKGNLLIHQKKENLGSRAQDWMRIV